MRRLLVLLTTIILLVAFSSLGYAARSVRIMVELDDYSQQVIDSVQEFAQTVNFNFPEIKTLAITVKETDIPAIQAMHGVKSMSRDNKVTMHAQTTWDLDIINVADNDIRSINEDGAGVYVAVLDTGLLPNWKDYLREEQVATEYAVGFLNPQENVNLGAWTGTEAHGTHVSSTILGYYFYGQFIDGVAPGAKVIPVKVLNNQGWGYDSAVTAGILYVANLKASGEILEPIVINMSLGSTEPNDPELAAIQYAIEQGVIIVASAGNEGELGMGWPGAYPEVISVGAAGWTALWEQNHDPITGILRWQADIAEPTDEGVVYVAEYSSRELNGQELDILAPGDWVYGPYVIYGRPPAYAKQDKMSQYYYLGGTSMAAPHVAGTAALMLGQNPTLTQEEIEGILRDTAMYIAPDSVSVFDPIAGDYVTLIWGTDATGAGLMLADEAVAAAAE